MAAGSCSKDLKSGPEESGTPRRSKISKGAARKRGAFLKV
jgi:hypothetical protein